MAVPKIKQKEMANRQAQIAKMYLEGKTQLEISVICKCSVGTVNRDLQILQKNWVESASADISEMKARELAKLDRLEAQAWESFFQSRKTTEKGSGKRRPPQKPSDEPKESHSEFKKDIITAGDPRFLTIVADCIEKRCRIIGIDAPGKIELTGAAGGPIEYKDRSQMAIHQLAVLLKDQGIVFSDNDDEEPEASPARDEE